MSLINSHMVKDNPSRDLNILYLWDPDFSPRMLYTAQTQTMELFSRRRWRLVSALLPNKFGYCRLCIASRYCFGISSPLSCPAPTQTHWATQRRPGHDSRNMLLYFLHTGTLVCVSISGKCDLFIALIPFRAEWVSALSLESQWATNIHKNARKESRNLF